MRLLYLPLRALAHRQAWKDVAAQVRGGLGHLTRIALGADAAVLAGENPQKIATTVVAADSCKAV